MAVVLRTRELFLPQINHQQHNVTHASRAARVFVMRKLANSFYFK